jgi:HPr kinase/phosphorylase
LFLKVRHFFQKNKKTLELRAQTQTTGFAREIIIVSDSDGLYSVQVWGKKEFRLLEKLRTPEQRQFLRKRADSGIVAVIFAEGYSFPRPVLEEALKKKMALLTSPLSQKKCQDRLEHFCYSSLGKIIPGGLLEIFGMGVMIAGDSGVGKSESALELISRGHRFISDDVTKCWISNGKLLGEAPEISRHFMEIRGLGIINIMEIFGAQAICPQAEIKLVIKLQRWKEGKEYDRMMLEFPRKFDILCINVPQLRIPVAPGRNLSNLIEVACKAHALREKGYHAPQDIEKRLDRALSNKKRGKRQPS